MSEKTKITKEDGIRLIIKGFPFVGAVALWLAVVAISGRGLFGTLDATAIVACFYYLVGIGQMNVIGLGNGNIDLSIPYVMTLSGVVSVDIMHHSDANAIPALAAGVGLGLCVGLGNVIVLRVLKINPIIGTLAVGFILESIAIRLTAAIAPPRPSPIVRSFTVERIAGVPIMVVVLLGLSIFAAWFIGLSVFGRSVRAIGQNVRASVLSGLRVEKTIIFTYMLSAILAAIAGILLASYAGGASLDASTPFLLGSIAVVVLGGLPISGGESSIVSVIGGALFLTFVTTAVTSFGGGAGIEDLTEGLVIVLAIAARPKRLSAGGGLGM